MRLTWRREPHETGLASVCESPRGWILKLDGEDVGHVSMCRVGWQEYRGWYWYARSDDDRIRPRNTSGEPVSTDVEAKASCRAYVVECLAKAAGSRRRA